MALAGPQVGGVSLLVHILVLAFVGVKNFVTSVTNRFSA